jgi:hypothetical protein
VDGVSGLQRSWVVIGLGWSWPGEREIRERESVSERELKRNSERAREREREGMHTVSVVDGDDAVAGVAEREI